MVVHTVCIYCSAHLQPRSQYAEICDFRFGALHGGGGARGGAQLNVSAAVRLRILQCGASEIEKRRDDMRDKFCQTSHVTRRKSPAEPLV
jgi:hypothetical protein